MTDSENTILIVDDEKDIVELFSMWLSPDYTLRVATDGNEALEILDESIDLVLLDRHMPRLTGDAVLETIRDRGLSCRVAMVTAVEPDLDITEMSFDAYLCKPVTKSALRSVVETLLARDRYDSEIQELAILLTKRSLLEQQLTHQEIEQSEQYAALVNRIKSMRP
ncbi:response regulator [Haladaptatus sp. ZSTT2]|uniref:response regulator n=1 Tax=Haladaptatus sp. ZSTT2 TaxID=3120515 RepID=UPI00300ECA2A